MTNTGDPHRPPHQRTYEANSDDIEVRQDEDSVFELRMPIASTGNVRNNGDDPLTRDEVDGMARQINDGSLTVGVFVDHGQTNIAGAARYSIAERVGEWHNADVTTRDNRDAELLEATARMMNPDSLPDIPVRGHLGTVKELAVRDMSVPASIGWADDEDAPGGVDLMEASVVGIQADKRTHSEASAGTVVARAAVDVGADPELLVEQVKAATQPKMTDQPPSEDSDTNGEQTADDGETTQRGMEEELREMREQMEENTTMTREMHEQMVGGEENADGDDELDDDADDDDQSAATDATDAGTDRAALAKELDALREELDEVREGGIARDDVDVPSNNEARDTDDEQTDDSGTGDAVKSLIK